MKVLALGLVLNNLLVQWRRVLSRVGCWLGRVSSWITNFLCLGSRLRSGRSIRLRALAVVIAWIMLDTLVLGS